MFEVNVGTSSTGTPQANAQVAKARKTLLEGIIKEALRSFDIREDIIEKIYSLPKFLAVMSCVWVGIRPIQTRNILQNPG